MKSENAKQIADAYNNTEKEFKELINEIKGRASRGRYDYQTHLTKHLKDNNDQISEYTYNRLIKLGYKIECVKSIHWKITGHRLEYVISWKW